MGGVIGGKEQVDVILEMSNEVGVEQRNKHMGEEPRGKHTHPSTLATQPCLVVC